MIPYFSIEYFQIGPITFYTWGFFVALAFLVGLALAIRRGKRIGLEAKKTIYLVIFIFIGAIAGGRIFFILQSPLDFFLEPVSLFRISEGGMMFYGGLFGGILAGWLYIRKWANCRPLISALTPLVPLAMAIGRIACFLSNDHLGAATSLPWAIKWPDGTLRHPVALYLILFDLALFGFLIWWRKKEKWPGQVLIVFLIIYGVGRFILDFSRDISADPHYLSFTTSQWISGALVILSVIYLFNRLTKASKFDINSNQVSS